MNRLLVPRFPGQPSTLPHPNVVIAVVSHLIRNITRMLNANADANADAAN